MKRCLREVTGFADLQQCNDVKSLGLIYHKFRIIFIIIINKTTKHKYFDIPYRNKFFFYKVNEEILEENLHLFAEHRHVGHVKEEMEDSAVCEPHEGLGDAGSPGAIEAGKRSSSEMDLHTHQSSSSKRVRVSNEVTEKMSAHNTARQRHIRICETGCKCGSVSR